MDTVSKNPPPPLRKPSRHGSQKRRMHVSIKAAMTPEERRIVEEKAAEVGLSLSAYARACLLGDAGPRAVRRASVDRQLLAQAVAELNKVGSNVNQIARALNSGHRVALPEIQKAGEELSIALQAILEAAGKA